MSMRSRKRERITAQKLNQTKPAEQSRASELGRTGQRRACNDCIVRIKSTRVEEFPHTARGEWQVVYAGSVSEERSHLFPADFLVLLKRHASRLKTIVARL